MSHTEKGSTTSTVEPFSPSLIKGEVQNLLQSAINIKESYPDWKNHASGGTDSKLIESGYQFANQVLNQYNQHKSDLGVTMPSSINFSKHPSGSNGGNR